MTVTYDRDEPGGGNKPFSRAVAALRACEPYARFVAQASKISGRVANSLGQT